MKKALLIVDVQNDFWPGGSLGVKDGDKVVEVINGLMDKFDLVISSQDWHPEETVPFEKWPVHCVAGTDGAEFHPALNSNNIDLRLKKVQITKMMDTRPLKQLILILANT